MSLEDRLHPLLSSYVASPQWVKSTVGRAYAALPDRIKYGRRFPYFQREVRNCYQSPELMAAVDAKLLKTLRAALLYVPAYAAYRNLLQQGLSPRELLSRLPLTSKLDIKADLHRYVSTRHGSRDTLEMFTGGSTAHPMRFFAQKHVTRPKEVAYFEDLDKRAGLRAGDVVLNLRGRTVPGAGQSGRRLWMYEPIKRHLILSSDHMEARYMPEYMSALREWKPTFIHAFPSALYPLAKWLHAHPEPEITSRIHGVELTSENTYDHQLKLIRSVFRCPVIRGYGHTERTLLGATMPDDDRFFFWPLYGYLELVDANGQTITQPGVLGEIVGTGFDNEVMPFVRYRTADMATWGTTPHPLLPGFPVLERVEGRLQEFVVCHDRRLVSITTLGAAHFSDLAEVETIQYEQSIPGRLTLRFVSRSEIQEGRRKAIADAVEAKAQGGLVVDVVRVPQIERTHRGKARMLIQHLDVGEYFGGNGVNALQTSKLAEADGSQTSRRPSARVERSRKEGPLGRLSWLMNRLQCMSMAEVGYRAETSLRLRWTAVWRGQPRLAPATENNATGKAWFTGDLPEYQQPALLQDAEQTVQGRFLVLALGMVSLGSNPQWNRDPKTGVEAPLEFGPRMSIGDMVRVGDIKYLWEPSRHLWLVPLAQAYRASGDRRYLDALVRLLDSWIEQCPHPLGPHWSSSLEAGIRLVNWSATWHLLGGDVTGSLLLREYPAFVVRWLDAVYWHMHFVSRNLSGHSSANNHLTGELAGLYLGLCTWPRWHELNRLRPLIRKRVREEALRQNTPDGVNREQATSYQQFVLDFLLFAGLCARAEGEDFDADYWVRLEAMCTFIAALRDAAGNVPQIGDADDGIACGVFMAGADNFSSLLATGALLFRRGDLAVAARTIDAKTVWLLGKDTLMGFEALRKESRPLSLPIVFEEGGYGVLGRNPTGPQEVRLVFDAGPLGYLGIAAHGHADALSVLLSVAGQPILVDPGTYSYLANPVWREHFRSTAAHNTVEVDGSSQSTSGGAFMWIRHANARWVPRRSVSSPQALAGEYSGITKRGVRYVHRRELTFDPSTGEVLVTDELEGAGVHEICLRWHLSDHVCLDLEGHRATITAANVRVEMALPSDGHVTVVRAVDDKPHAWVSRAFERRTASSTLECRAVGIPFPVRWVTRMRCIITG